MKLELANPQYWRNAGDIYYEKKDHELVLKCYKKMVKLNSEHRLNWNCLGLCYHDMEDYDNACKCYKRAVKLNSSDAVA